MSVMVFGVMVFVVLSMVVSGFKVGDIDFVNGQKIFYYYDFMVLVIKFDKFGKLFFMDMQFVLVYVGVDGDEGKVSVSLCVQQNLGVCMV